MSPLELFLLMLAFAGGLFPIGLVVALTVAMVEGARKGVRKNSDTHRII